MENGDRNGVAAAPATADADTGAANGMGNGADAMDEGKGEDAVES